MSIEQLVRDLVDRVWNGGHLDELDRYFAPAFEHGDRTDDLTGLRAWHEADAATWAQTTYQIQRLVAGGDAVAVHWRATGRQIGAWGPVPPTGRTVTWDGVHFFTVRDDRIVAMWATADLFSKAQQLGVTMVPPSPGDP